MLANLAELVNGDALLVRRGAHVDTTFLVEVGERAFLVTVAQGRIVRLGEGPFVMPRWTFALRASARDWREFWKPLPAPGFHDLFALIKRRALVAEGDLHVFMANLFYFKGMLAKPRELPRELAGDRGEAE